MKHTLLNKTLMLRFTAFIFVLSLSASACKKNDTQTASVTEEEAVEVITQAVSSESGGMTELAEVSSRTASESTLDCNSSKDTAFSGSSEAGAAITYSYSQQATTKMICSNGLPAQFEFEYTGENIYSAARMSSDDTNSASVIVSGLQPNQDNLVLNQSYTRNGTQQSKVRLQRSFSSTLTIASENIAVSKETYKILSGTGSIAFNAQTSDGASVTYSASIEFSGNNQATVTFQNGSNFAISW